MRNGISLYPGLDNTLAENLALIDRAAEAGITRIFTSLHIPETDTRALRCEIATILAAARQHHMEVISDVSPATRDLLGIPLSPDSFRDLGITTLRLDDGFTPEETAALSHEDGIHIALNASTMTKDLLADLRKSGIDFSHTEAIHNFYPRPGTGLSPAFVKAKNDLLHAAGIQTAAFVPCHARPRSPLFAGLPTIEAHRHASTSFAARHLAALGCDSVFLADSLPRDDELAALARLQPGTVTLAVHLLSDTPAARQLLTKTYTSRLDEAACAIRARESRAYLKELSLTIEPAPAAPRPVGAVTIDSSGYGRYMGELQIITTPQPPDEKTVVVAQVEEEDLPLLALITPGRRFAFQLIR